MWPAGVWAEGFWAGGYWVTDIQQGLLPGFSEINRTVGVSASSRRVAADRTVRNAGLKR